MHWFVETIREKNQAYLQWVIIFFIFKYTFQAALTVFAQLLTVFQQVMIRRSTWGITEWLRLAGSSRYPPTQPLCSKQHHLQPFALGHDQLLDISMRGYSTKSLSYPCQVSIYLNSLNNNNNIIFYAWIGFPVFFFCACCLLSCHWAVWLCLPNLILKK